MHRLLTLALIVALFAGIVAADDKPVRSDLTPKDLARVLKVTAPTTDFTKPEQFEPLPAGAATTKKLINRDIFSQFSANLSFDDQEKFSLGNGFFRKEWVAAPASTQASDGLGPLFNSRGCQNCHLKDGRGHPPMGAADDGVSMFLRLSVPPSTEAEKQALASGQQNVVPEPTYGTQLQNFAVTGLKAEGQMRVSYTDLPVTLGDGTVVTLRVSDTGPGVPARARDNLFRPFQGGVRQGGTGLGLAICAELVRAHGGTIELIGDGPGATFEITIADRVIDLTRIDRQRRSSR